MPCQKHPEASQWRPGQIRKQWLWQHWFCKRILPFVASGPDLGSLVGFAALSCIVWRRVLAVRLRIFEKRPRGSSFPEAVGHGIYCKMLMMPKSKVT